MKAISMKLKHSLMVLLSLMLGVVYYFSVGDGGRPELAVVLGACNLSMSVLYIYATFSACNSQLDYRFKVTVYCAVLAYAAIYLFLNVKLYKDLQVRNPDLQSEGFVAYLAVAVVLVMVLVFLQALKTRKKWVAGKV